MSINFLRGRRRNPTGVRRRIPRIAFCDLVRVDAVGVALFQMIVQLEHGDVGSGRVAQPHHRPGRYGKRSGRVYRNVQNLRGPGTRRDQFSGFAFLQIRKAFGVEVRDFHLDLYNP